MLSGWNGDHGASAPFHAAETESKSVIGNVLTSEEVVARIAPQVRSSHAERKNARLGLRGPIGRSVVSHAGEGERKEGFGPVWGARWVEFGARCDAIV